MKMAAMKSNVAEMRLSDRATNLVGEYFQRLRPADVSWSIPSRVKHSFALLIALCSAAVGVFAQDQTINGNLKVVGSTLELNGRQTHVLNYLSGNTPNPTTDSYRYEVARLCVNAYHWQQTGPIEIELRQAYFGLSGYLKFVVTAGYQDAAGSVTLLEKFGSALYANVSLGTPVATGTSFGGYANQYIPVYVDLGYYTYWHVQLTHGWTEVADDIPTTAGRLKFFANPAATILPGYVAAPGGNSRLGSRELFAGKIGIGTTNPDSGAKLHVAGGILTSLAFSSTTDSTGGIDYFGGGLRLFSVGSSGATKGTYTFIAKGADGSSATQMTVDSAGNVGIGTSSPGASLDVSRGSASGGTAVFRGSNNYSHFNYSTTEDTYIRGGKIGSVVHINDAAIGNVLLAETGGNVGIGTTSPTHKLAVNGTIRAKEVIVDTGWADHVFAKSYRLAPLSEVEEHIEKQGHLPGIPSAAEVEQGGVSLGDMQAKMLAKIEELTLHVIRQEKQMKAMQAVHETEITALRQQLSALNSHP